MYMDPKSEAIKRTLDKDVDKLSSKMAQSLVYQKSIIREQEDMLKHINKKKEEMIARRESAKKQLQKYIDGKPYDDTYSDLKSEYQSSLAGIDSLNKAITICEESVEEVKLGMGRNDPV